MFAHAPNRCCARGANSAALYTAFGTCVDHPLLHHYTVVCRCLKLLLMVTPGAAKLQQPTCLQEQHPPHHRHPSSSLRTGLVNLPCTTVVSRTDPSPFPPPRLSTACGGDWRGNYVAWEVTASSRQHCCQLAFFNARFHTTSIFQKRLALKFFKFYLLFGIKILSTVFTVWHLNFLETVNKASNLAFLVPGFGIGPA